MRDPAARDAGSAQVEGPSTSAMTDSRLIYDPRERELLQSEIIPRLFEGREGDDPVRVWVIGCATGEAAYSLGILILEHLAGKRAAPQVQIFATDSDQRALAIARRGRYSEVAQVDARPECLERWFAKEGSGFTVVKELREICVFAPHSLLRDPPFSRIDLVSCRDPLGRFDAHLQESAIAAYHFALRPGGFLLLGPAMAEAPSGKLFAAFDRGSHLYRRLDGPAAMLLRTPGEDDGGLLLRGSLSSGASEIEEKPKRRGDVRAERGPSSADAEGAKDERLLQVEAELRVAKGRLHAAIEALARSDEQLRTSNEEYQSINEEMKTANEELESSKEELQAINEELQATTGELRRRLNDLARANADLKNLLDSTRIATLFLDSEFRLRSFTPACGELFKVIETDVGRPIADIAAQVLYPEMQDDMRGVLKSLVQVEREVSSCNGAKRYLVRVLPYRTEDNFIAGVVVTFLDITASAHAEAALRTSERRFSEAQNLAGVGVWEWNLAADELWWSPVLYRLWGAAPAETPPALAHRRIHPDDLPQYETARAEARLRGELNVEWRVVLPDGSVRWLAETGRRESGEGGGRMLGVTQDITLRKTTELRLKMLLGELQHRVRNILAVVRSVVSRTVASSSNLEELAPALDGRLDSLARTQGVFTRGDVSTVELEEIVREELITVAARDDQVTIEGPMVRLKRQAAEVLSLTLHELCTNAVKYGAFSAPSGRLNVTWRIEESRTGPQLLLEWREAGVRALDTRPSRSGFGRELIEHGLPYELGASTSLEFARGGMKAFIELPLTEKVAEVAGFNAMRHA